MTWACKCHTSRFARFRVLTTHLKTSTAADHACDLRRTTSTVHPQYILRVARHGCVDAVICERALRRPWPLARPFRRAPREWRSRRCTRRRRTTAARSACSQRRTSRPEATRVRQDEEKEGSEQERKGEARAMASLKGPSKGEQMRTTYLASSLVNGAVNLGVGRLKGQQPGLDLGGVLVDEDVAGNGGGVQNNLLSRHLTVEG